MMKNKLMILLLIGFLLTPLISSVSANPTVPGQPVNLTRLITLNETGYHMYITWDPPMLDGGSEITGYKIEYTDSLGSYTGNQSEIWDVLVADTGNTDTNYTHSHSTAEAYCYRVSAINSVGVGLPSLYVASCGGMATIPDAPTNVQAVRISGSQIDISWTPSDDNGVSILGYKIEYKTGSDQVIEILIENTESKDTFYSHINPSDDWHYYRVYAINGFGRSPVSSGWAQASNYEGGATTPGVPRNVQAVGVDYDKINISWDPPENDGGSPIIGYKIDKGYTVYIENTGNTTTWCTHPGSKDELTNQPYLVCYFVAAINSLGVGRRQTTGACAMAVPPDDTDGDGTKDEYDNCPDLYNPNQKNNDSDAFGNMCDVCPDDSSNLCQEARSNKDPGFELIPFLLVFALIIFWKRKKRV